MNKQPVLWTGWNCDPYSSGGDPLPISRWRADHLMVPQGKCCTRAETCMSPEKRSSSDSMKTNVVWLVAAMTLHASRCKHPQLHHCECTLGRWMIHFTADRIEHEELWLPANQGARSTTVDGGWCLPGAGTSGHTPDNHSPHVGVPHGWLSGSMSACPWSLDPPCTQPYMPQNSTPMRPGPKPGIEACRMAMQVLQLVVQSDIICQEVMHLDKLPTADLLHQPVRDGVSCRWQNEARPWAWGESLIVSDSLGSLPHSEAIASVPLVMS